MVIWVVIAAVVAAALFLGAGWAFGASQGAAPPRSASAEVGLEAALSISTRSQQASPRELSSFAHRRRELERQEAALEAHQMALEARHAALHGKELEVEAQLRSLAEETRRLVGAGAPETTDAGEEQGPCPECEGLNRQLEVARRTARAAQADGAGWHAAQRQARSEVRQLEDELGSARGALEALRKEHRGLGEDFAEERRRRGLEEREREAERRAHEELRGSHEELHGRHRALRDAHDALQRSEGELRGRWETLEARREVLEGQLEELQEAHRSLAASRSSLEADHGWLETAQAALEAERDALLAERQATAEARDGLIAERDGLIAERGALQQRERRREALDGRLEALEGQLAAAFGVGASALPEILDLRGRLAAVELAAGEAAREDDQRRREGAAVDHRLLSRVAGLDGVRRAVIADEDGLLCAPRDASPKDHALAAALAPLHQAHRELAGLLPLGQTRRWILSGDGGALIAEVGSGGAPSTSMLSEPGCDLGELLMRLESLPAGENHDTAPAPADVTREV